MMQSPAARFRICHARCRLIAFSIYLLTYTFIC